MQKKIQNALISVSDKSDLNKVLYFLNSLCMSWALLKLPVHEKTTEVFELFSGNKARGP